MMRRRPSPHAARQSQPATTGRARRLMRRAAALAGTSILAVASLQTGAFATEPGVGESKRSEIVTSLKPGDTAFCWEQPNPDGKSWTAATTYGSATFSERGEYLKVEDRKSNGWRIVARFSWCENGPTGVFRGWLHRDSGPDEGEVDRQTYDFEFAEGRRVIFQVCEKNMTTGALRDCGATELAYA